jgi:hypothetical protein
MSMDIWDILAYGAWTISAALLLYILVDTFMVGARFSEDLLLSSREGEDELLIDDEKREAPSND